MTNSSKGDASRIGDPCDAWAAVASERTERSSKLCPIWILNVRSGNALARRIAVLAPSSNAALSKGREQLDDGESLSFCFTQPAADYRGLPPASRVYQPG